MSKTEGGQTDADGTADKQTTQTAARGISTRLRDADNIADKQMTQTAARGISTRLRVATVKRSQRQGQRTQFVRLGRQKATNERTNDRGTIALRIVNPPTHSCCAMPRFIGAPLRRRLPPGHATGMGPKPGQRARPRTNKPGTRSAKQQGKAKDH
jgi:hypothetical protein